MNCELLVRVCVCLCVCVVYDCVIYWQQEREVVSSEREVLICPFSFLSSPPPHPSLLLLASVQMCLHFFFFYFNIFFCSPTLALCFVPFFYFSFLCFPKFCFSVVHMQLEQLSRRRCQTIFFSLCCFFPVCNLFSFAFFLFSQPHAVYSCHLFSI